MVNKAPDIEILKRFLVNDSIKKELIVSYFRSNINSAHNSAPFVFK